MGLMMGWVEKHIAHTRTDGGIFSPLAAWGFAGKSATLLDPRVICSGNDKDRMFAGA